MESHQHLLPSKASTLGHLVVSLQGSTLLQMHMELRQRSQVQRQFHQELGGAIKCFYFFVYVLLERTVTFSSNILNLSRILSLRLTISSFTGLKSLMYLAFRS